MAHSEPMTDKERERILEMLKRGNLTHREISRRVGRAQSSISRLAKSAEIQTVAKRKRSAAAKEVEGTFSRDERVNLADKVLGVVSNLVEEGGLNPRDLRETTMALKEALAARRLEDHPEEEKKEDNTFWDAAFASEDSPGLGYDPNTEIGRKMIEYSKRIDAGENVFETRRAEEKAAREAAQGHPGEDSGADGATRAVNDEA